MRRNSTRSCRRNGRSCQNSIACGTTRKPLQKGGRGTGPHLAPSPLPYEAFAGQVRHPANAMPPYTTIVLSDRDLADIFAYLLTIPPLVDPKSAAILDN